MKRHKIVLVLLTLFISASRRSGATRRWRRWPRQLWIDNDSWRSSDPGDGCVVDQ
jgi:hypothetical protein